MIHLGTEQAAGDRVIRITADMNGTAVLDGNQQTAGIGTVIRADRTDGDRHRWNPFFPKNYKALYLKSKNNCS
jgi:hypothetical protein